MSNGIATALIAGDEPSPELAVNACRHALAKLGEGRCNAVLLFLTADFAGRAQHAITAVARTASCLQVAGGMAAGVCTEQGWVLDRPAAAVMVFAGDPAIVAPGASASASEGEPLLSYVGDRFLPGWEEDGQCRFGGSFSGRPGRSDPIAWQSGRLLANCSVHVSGAKTAIGVSLGWRFLSGPLAIEDCHGHDVLRIDGRTPLNSLMSAVVDYYGIFVPPGWQPPPIGSLCAVRIDRPNAAGVTSGSLLEAHHQPLAIVDIGADESLTLTEATSRGQRLAWAMRTPEVAEDDMRQSVARLARATPSPMAALLFSCIGRGPYFHGGDDRDLAVLRQRFSTLPILGSYGTAQIAPTSVGGSRLLQNAVVTALLAQPERRHDV